MRSFKGNTLHLLSATLLSLAFVGTPVRAQENIPSPPGWRKTVVGSDTVFSPLGSHGSYTVKRLTPRSGNFQRWFDAQVQQDSTRRGRVVSTRPMPPDNSVYCVARTVRSAGGQQNLFYVGYPVGNFGRLTIFEAPSERLLLQHVRNLKGLGTQVASLDRNIRQHRATSATPPRTLGSSSPLKHNPRDIPIPKPPRL